MLEGVEVEPREICRKPDGEIEESEPIEIEESPAELRGHDRPARRMARCLG